MPTSSYAAKCRYLHYISLRLDAINPPSISFQHVLLIGFELGPSDGIKGEIVLLDFLKEEALSVL